MKIIIVLLVAVIMCSYNAGKYKQGDIIYLKPDSTKAVVDFPPSGDNTYMVFDWNGKTRLVTEEEIY